MKKRLLSALLALCMMLTMMPTVAFAADEPGAGTADPVADPTTLTSWAENGESTLANSSRDTGRIWTDKSVSTGNVTLRNSENTQTIVVQKTANADFLVGLSALSSASSLATTTSKPLDIVLVLDVSGSMDNDGSHIDGYTPVYNIQNNEEYYIADGYRHRKLSYENGRWYYWTQNHWGNWERRYVTPKENENDNTSGHVQFYVYSRVTKMEALQDAVGQFIDSTKEKNMAISNENLKHRIALVKFASDSDNDIGNDFTDEKYNKSQVVSDFTTGLDNLKQTVNRLQGEGATRADYGMKQAERVINGTSPLTGAREEAEKIVIFFTDGNPTSFSTFDDEVAGSAINTAYDLKAAGVMIYSIGVFEDADPSDTRGNFNKYMNAVSSNYPDAECTDWWGEQTNNFERLELGTRAADKQYYFAATDAEGLNEVFQAIDEDTQQAASPTEVVTNDPQHSGYITFTDQLGEYMEVKDVNEVVFAGQKFYHDESPTASGNVTTYHFSGSIPDDANSIYPNGNLSDLIVQVTKDSDAKTGDIVTVRIPASLIPLRYYDIKTEDGNTEMSISETYPIRVFYSVGLKDNVVDKNGVATVDDSYAYKDDENVYFYSNAWAQNGETATALTTAEFTPANTNSFYYITAGTPLYVKNGDAYEPASSYTSSATYYYAHTYYTKDSGTTTPVTQYEQVPAGSLSDANTGVRNGQLCVTESIAKTDSPQKFVVNKRENTTGTAAAAISPAWSESDVRVSLGNNGKITATAPVTTGSLTISKTVTADSGLTAPDQAFTFTVTLKDGDAPLADSFSYTVDGGAGGTITNGGTITLKHGQTATITGIPAGTKYEVTETPVAGFTADPTDATGTIVADETRTAAFTNTYAVTPLEANANTDLGLAGTKTMTGREFKSGDSFTFKVTPQGDAPELMKDGQEVTQVTIRPSSGHSAAFAFDATVTFTEPGTYTYWVKEENPNVSVGGSGLPGVSYDPTDYLVTITVADNHDGELFIQSKSIQKQDAGSAAEALVFNNSYKASGDLDPENTAVLNVTKHLQGRDWTNNDSFTFTITRDSANPNAPMPNPAQVTITNATSNHTASFGAISYTEADAGKVYYYHISENEGDLPNMEYAEDQLTVKVSITDNGDGTLRVTAEYDNSSAVTATDKRQTTEAPFTNIYTANGELAGDAYLQVSKTINGREWTDQDEFAFILTGQNGAPMPEGSTSNTKEITISKDQMIAGDSTTAVDSFTGSFGTIQYTQPGAYTYTITEKAPASQPANGMTYSQAEYQVVVTVQDSATEVGKLNVSSVMTKVKNDDGTGVSTPIADHTAAFINTYDASSVTIGGDSGNAGIAVEKILTGRENNEWIDTDAFTFKLTAGTNTAAGGINTPMPNSETVTIDKDTPDHTASFGAITYDAVGEYYYTIAEEADSLGGITYDDRTVNVTVKVEDPGDGQLTASVTYGAGATGDKAVFTNTYKAEGDLNPPDPSEGMNKLVVSKTLWGRDWTDDDTFTFVLYGQDSAPMPAGSNGGYKEITLTSADVMETTEDGWGIATGDFGDIHYTLTDSKSATYYYTISEKPDTVPGAENIDYDAHRAKVIVMVKDEKGDGKLTVDVTYMGINALTVSDMQSDASTAFTNSFEATGTLQGEKFLKVVKTIDGRDWKDDDQFTFTLEPQDNAPKPQDGNLKVTLTKDDLVSGETNTAVGSFGNIYFNSPDTYYYKITEQSSNDSAMIDSNAEYMVEVVVTNNGSVNMPVSVNTTQTKGDDGRVTRVPVSDWNAAFTNYAKTITITPADVTIYMGGDDGYGAVEGSDTNTSLPDPLFHIDLANADGTDPESIIFKNETSGKSWTVVRAGETADGIPLYRLVAAEGQDPVRVQYLDGDQAIVSDTFVPALEHELYKEYAIELYYGGNQPDQISASVGNQTFSVEDKQGTLTVRVVENTESETDSNPVYHVSETAPGADSTLPATVTAPADTYYMRNDTTVRVDNEDGIGLLFDNIYDSDNGTNERQNALIDKTNAAMGAAASNVTRHYEARYLDLVDANNGNVWVKASQPVTVYWAYPEGTDANTTFSLYHYAGLHRDDQYDGQSGYDIDDINAITPQNVDVQKGEYGISFTVQPGGFSPFVLVWETSGGGTSGGGGNNKPDDLNTEDHFAYIIGYPKDYRTGEPTDDESLWPVEPQGNITRAEVATIFFRMLTDDARSENWSQTNDYTDVASTDWYNNAISTLSNMGIISGDPSGAFRPDDSITRAEFTKIAVGFFDKAGDYVDGTYDDVSSSDWYADFIDAAVDLGLIEGYPDGTIRPEATITRAEACTIVNRTLGRVPDKDHLLPADEMRVWPDNSDTDEWYYAQIQEATNSHDYEWIGEENDQIENWTEKLEDRDWAQLEREWSDANSAPGGEVVD